MKNKKKEQRKREGKRKRTFTLTGETVGLFGDFFVIFDR